MQAPIALFVYNRLEHTSKTVSALAGNVLAAESDLFVFSDSPKQLTDSDSVERVRNFLATISGFKSVSVINRPTNFGLKRSIIEGVTEVVAKYGKVIVMEDDLLTSRYFLQYMNEALSKYENETNVISIHGYNYPAKHRFPETFFLRGADCWGWATWKRGWDLIEFDGTSLLNEIERRKLEFRFNYNNSYPFTGMLREQILGKNNSWAILWYASAFVKDKLTLYPGQSLVQNIGFDSSGTHSDNNQRYNVSLSDRRVSLNETIPVVENEECFQAIVRYFRGDNLIKSIIGKLRNANHYTKHWLHSGKAAN